MIKITYKNMNTDERVIRVLPISEDEQIELFLNGFVAEEVESEIQGVRDSMKIEKMNGIEEELIAIGMDKQKLKLINRLVVIGFDVSRVIQLVRDNKFRIFEKCNDIVDVAKVLVSEGASGMELTHTDDERLDYEKIGESLNNEGCFFNLGNGKYIVIYDDYFGA